MKRALLALALISACTRSSATSGALSSSRTPVINDVARHRIDSTLESLTNAGEIAGVSAVVWEQGREVYWGSFGMADRAKNRPMTRDVIVQIFSMTKPITGVALMTLFEQGKFKLDDPLSMYLPEFANVRVYGANGALETPHRPILVRDITRHTAGFANGAGDPGVGPLFRAANPTDQNNTVTQFSQKLATVPLAFHPGEKWAYGISVDVQAALVERLAGMPFAQYVRQRVLDPLQMRQTRYVVPAADRGRFAAMYNRSGPGVVTQQPDGANSRESNFTPGAYGLTSTIDDYLRFTRMLLNGGELNGVRILEPETVRLMATSHLSDDVTDRQWLPSKGRVGFGIDFAVRTRPPADAKENNGVVGEFFWDGAASTLFWVDPVNELTAVLFVQLMPFDRVGLHKGFRDAVYGPFVEPR
jgi:CubicO group peptidase (beta-lactamase class C family)